MDWLKTMEEIKTLNFQERNYPKALRKIKGAPKVLYYRGDLFPIKKCFAVVGTRRCSDYGKDIAFRIAGDLSEAGFIIVSGLAPGIDTACHQAVVEKNKRTIAVLGTGVDENSIYPKENIDLSRKILETGGCLISEYPAGTPGAKFTFPNRNRIISGLSLGVLVIEAKERSGALITADWAKKQGRKIFAVPGSIHSLNSKGSHYLIKQGAKLVESAEDILKEFNFPTEKPDFQTPDGSLLNKEGWLILETLKIEPLYVDKIIEKTKLPAAIIASTIAILEIEGKVKNLGGNVYAIGNC
jgi:DNA processing protein